MKVLETLAKEVGVSERTLRRAANEGTLRTRRPTPRRLEISPAERAYVRRSWPLLSELRRVLRTEPNIRFALLFGSTARGEDTKTSDVDLVVQIREGGLDRTIDLQLKLGRALGREVDVVALEDAKDNLSLLAEIVSEGRVVIDRDQCWPPLRSHEAALRRAAEQAKRRRTKEALAGIDRMLGR
jgi:predicted nucleotidyltransferase